MLVLAYFRLLLPVDRTAFLASLCLFLLLQAERSPAFLPVLLLVITVIYLFILACSRLPLLKDRPASRRRQPASAKLPSARPDCSSMTRSHAFYGFSGRTGYARYRLHLGYAYWEHPKTCNSNKARPLRSRQTPGKPIYAVTDR